MRAIYLRKNIKDFQRKVLIDMAYLAEHDKIRLPKYYFEEGLYISYYKDIKDPNSLDKYFITKDKIISEDDNHFFFKFPFKPEQVEKVN